MSGDTKARQVSCEIELERGVFTGQKYYIMTPRFDYIATLEAVTGNCFVFSDVSVCFESGAYDDLRAGKPKDSQFLTKRAVFDRAGCVLAELP